MSKTVLIKDALIVTMDEQRRILRGNILINGNRIEEISAQPSRQKADEVFEAAGYIITPGFIQTHIHLCQTLFRNFADDLLLLDWLQKKIWPFEGRHTYETLSLSARLGIAELFKGGTTTILDMGTVHHQDAVFEAMRESGIRGYSGKTMMDFGIYPAGLQESTADSLAESQRLAENWHNTSGGRLRYAFAPRFAVSCSEELLVKTKKLSREFDTLYHTHASENRDEIRLVEERFGLRNIRLFQKLGLTDDKLCLAHCVWTDEPEREILRDYGVRVLHCPSANLKLGSGIAPIPDYLNRGIRVSLGADGAPCNNNLDIFTEMRHAALIQKPFYGAEAMPAGQVLAMATIDGARALHLEKEIGSLEPGKKADICFIRNEAIHALPYENIYARLVYASKSADVEHLMIDGQWVYRNGQLTTLDENGIISETLKAMASMTAQII